MNEKHSQDKTIQIFTYNQNPMNNMDLGQTWNFRIVIFDLGLCKTTTMLPIPHFHTNYLRVTMVPVYSYFLLKKIKSFKAYFGRILSPVKSTLINVQNRVHIKKSPQSAQIHRKL